MRLSMLMLRATPLHVANMDVFMTCAMMVNSQGVALAPAALA
jgi:hypothetical protein